MQSLNVLLMGSKSITKLKTSKYINKLYTTSDNIEGSIFLSFNTFKELAQKCKTLQIDIVLIEEEKWILEGIANVMKQNNVNCFAPTSDLTELALSNNYARKMLKKYNINVPPTLNLPIEFPVLVKGDGILKKANSIQEIIEIKEKIFNISPEIARNIFLEKYIEGKKQKVTSLFDGKNLLTFPNKELDTNLLKTYTYKLKNMLLSEKSNFIGFINSELIQYENIIYNTGFSFNFEYPDLNDTEIEGYRDILFICLSAIYQKLNEIEL